MTAVRFFILLLAICSKTVAQRDFALFFVNTEFEHWEDFSKSSEQQVLEIAYALDKQYGFEVEIVQNVNRLQTIAKLEEYVHREFEEGDQLLIYISSHGYFKEGRKGALIPTDGKREDFSGDSWILHPSLEDWVNAIPCRHILLALDACYSGTFGAQFRGDPTNPPWREERDCKGKREEALRYQSRLYLTSGGAERTPVESEFAGMWLEALRARNEDGILGYHGLFDVLKDANPKPRAGNFMGHEAAGDFLFLDPKTCDKSLEADPEALDVQLFWSKPKLRMPGDGPLKLAERSIDIEIIGVSQERLMPEKFHVLVDNSPIPPEDSAQLSLSPSYSLGGRHQYYYSGTLFLPGGENEVQVTYGTPGNHGIVGVSSMQSFSSPPLTTPATPEPLSSTFDDRPEAYWLSHFADAGTSVLVNKRFVSVKSMLIMKQTMLGHVQARVSVNNQIQDYEIELGASATQPSGNRSRQDFIARVRLREGINELRIVFFDKNFKPITGHSETLLLNYIVPEKPDLHVYSINIPDDAMKRSIKYNQAFLAGITDAAKVNYSPYKEVEVYEMSDLKQTTTQNLKMVFVKLQRSRLQESDVLILYFTGRLRLGEEGEVLLLPSDYNPKYEDILSLDLLKDVLERLRMVKGKKVVFFDFNIGKDPQNPYELSCKPLTALFDMAPNVTFYSACTRVNEKGVEDDRSAGAFSKAIYEAVSGRIEGTTTKADFLKLDEGTGQLVEGEDGIITVGELEQFLKLRLAELTGVFQSPELSVRLGQGISEDMSLFLVEP